MDSFGYQDETSRPFIEFETAIRGRYDRGMIVTDPPHAEADIGHSFGIDK